MKKVTISNVEQLREALEAAGTVNAVEAVLLDSSVRALRSYAKQENYYFGKPLTKVMKDELVKAILGSLCAELDIQPETFAKPEFKTLSTIDKLIGIISGKYDRWQLTSTMIADEREEICRLLNISEADIEELNEAARKSKDDPALCFSDYVRGKLVAMRSEDEYVREPETVSKAEDEPKSEQGAGDTVTKLINVTGLMFEEFTTAMGNNAAEIIDSNSYEEVYEKLMTVDKVTMNFICSWFEIGEVFYHDPKKDKKEKVAKKYAKLIWEKIERVFPRSVQETPSAAIIASITEAKSTVMDIEPKINPESESEPEVKDAGVSGYQVAITHGRMFSEGKISKEYLLEQVHRPEYQTEYYGYAHGLAEVFGIAQGYDDESIHTWINYSYEELLPQLEEFIEDYELKVDPESDYGQETGFMAYRGKGEEFIRSEVSAEEILSKLKIPNYPGMAHGLAAAFHIPVKGKSYSELIASIAEFVRDYDKPLNTVADCTVTAVQKAM